MSTTLRFHALMSWKELYSYIKKEFDVQIIGQNNEGITIGVPFEKISKEEYQGETFYRAKNNKFTIAKRKQWQINIQK